MRRFAFTLVGLVFWLAPDAASAQTLPFEGKWARRAELCAPTSVPPSEERPAPFTLSALGLTSTIMTCEFTSVLPGGLSFRVEANCIAGTERLREFFIFAVIGEWLHWGWDKGTASFVRCPG